MLSLTQSFCKLGLCLLKIPASKPMDTPLFSLMAYLQSIFIYNHAQKLVELQAKKMSHLHLIIISGWVVLYRVNVETIIARKPFGVAKAVS
jgi:hypothetical protein